MSGRKKYGRGAILVEPLGENPRDAIHYQITERQGDWAILKKLETVWDGYKWGAGAPDVTSKTFRRKLRRSEGWESGFAIVHPEINYVGWARVPERRGGKRRGSGRPKGTVKGRHALSVSVSMSANEWALIDKNRGGMPRGKYLAKIHQEFLLKKHSTNTETRIASPEVPRDVP